MFNTWWDRGEDLGGTPLKFLDGRKPRRLCKWIKSVLVQKTLIRKKDGIEPESFGGRRCGGGDWGQDVRALAPVLHCWLTCDHRQVTNSALCPVSPTEIRGRVRNGGEGVLDGEHSTNAYLFFKKSLRLG